MIRHALNMLEAELETFMQSFLGGPNNEGDGGYVILGNVAQTEGDEAENLRGQIILSLVNIEEESAYKNFPNYQKGINGGVVYQNAPVFLNLYILFSAFIPNNYANALQRLSAVITFFQGRRVFNLQNAPGFDPGNDPNLTDFQLILDLYTMTFEQINHLWGSLGGKQMPFVMYKARLVRIQDRRPTSEGPVIEEIGREEQVI